METARHDADTLRLELSDIREGHSREVCLFLECNNLFQVGGLQGQITGLRAALDQAQEAAKSASTAIQTRSVVRPLPSIVSPILPPFFPSLNVCLIRPSPPERPRD